MAQKKYEARFELCVMTEAGGGCLKKYPNTEICLKKAKLRSETGYWFEYKKRIERHSSA